MTVDWLAEARAMADTLAKWREMFHRDPEMGNEEYRTREKIEAILDELGVPHRRYLDTAVVGRLDGARPGPLIALRADMDALPLQEVTGAPFASRHPGVMHACGHDCHMAALLGAAALLKARRSALSGAALFVFQPDEEGSGGAERLVKAGALDGARAVFGCHVSPDLPEGRVGVRDGKFYAASDVFDLTVTGVSCHGAEREKGVDALAAACDMVRDLIALPDRLGGERSVVTVGALHAGTARNIVPGTAELQGIVRTLGPEAREAMRGLVRDTVARQAERHGVTADLRMRASYPGVVNDDRMTALVRAAARETLGDAAVREIERPTMTTEDFGYYMDVCPGAYWHVGAGCDRPLHAPDFLPSAGAVVTAAAVHAAVAAKAMEALA